MISSVNTLDRIFDFCLISCYCLCLSHLMTYISRFLALWHPKRLLNKALKWNLWHSFLSLPNRCLWIKSTVKGVLQCEQNCYQEVLSRRLFSFKPLREFKTTLFTVVSAPWRKTKNCFLKTLTILNFDRIDDKHFCIKLCDVTSFHRLQLDLHVEVKSKYLCGLRKNCFCLF